MKHTAKSFSWRIAQTTSAVSSQQTFLEITFFLWVS